MITKEKSTTVQALPMMVFPTYGSLKEVFELGESKLPITNKNDLISLLVSYHNTLLKVQKETV